MSTMLSDIRTDLQSLGYGTDTAAAQTAAINSVNRRIEGMRRWPWQEATSATAAVAVGSSVVTATPSDLLHIDTLRLESGTNYLDLEWKPPTEVRRRLHLDRDNGTPTVWTNTESQFLVYPRADLAYVATLDYVKDPGDLVNDTDLIGAPDTYRDIWKWGAAAELAYRERDWFFVNVAKQEFAERLREMEEELLGVRQRQSSRQVTRSDWWDSF